MTTEIDDDEISALIDGDIDGERHRMILGLAETDAALKARILACAQNDRRLRQAAALAYDDTARLPPDLAGLAGSLAQRLRSEPPGPGWHLLRVPAGLGIAAGLILALMAGWWAGSQAQSGPTAPNLFIDEAKDAHLAASLVPGYGTVIDDAALQRLEQAFAHHLDPPDLGVEGLHLVGVDVVPTDIGPALLFGYLDEAGQRFTLILSFADELRAGEGTAERPITEVQGGLAVSFWHDGKAAYALVGAAALPRMAGIVRSIAADRPV